MNDYELSLAIEALLVARNPRQMQKARAALEPGYFLRAAELLRDISGTVLIGTGFPVVGTFETDGPVGAIALYEALQALGAEPLIACAAPLSQCIDDNHRVLNLETWDIPAAAEQTRTHLEQLRPAAVISIERPGLAADGRYYNMRGEDISEHTACFDHYLNLAECPTIAIGDGGNEIGMGRIRDTIAQLDIKPAITSCDELLVADVSNWAAYGLIALLGHWRGVDLLADIAPLNILYYLSQRGSVDGVTRENTLTEDGLPASEGAAVIEELRQLCRN